MPFNEVVLISSTPDVTDGHLLILKAAQTSPPILQDTNTLFQLLLLDLLLCITVVESLPSHWMVTPLQ